MQVKKQQLELDMEKQTGSKLEKEYNKAVYCHPAYLTYMHIMQNPGLDESQAGIKIARRNINNLRVLIVILKVLQIHLKAFIVVLSIIFVSFF